MLKQLKISQHIRDMPNSSMQDTSSIQDLPLYKFTPIVNYTKKHQLHPKIIQVLSPESEMLVRSYLKSIRQILQQCMRVEILAQHKIANQIYLKLTLIPHDPLQLFKSSMVHAVYNINQW
ncbi:hypothetical protein L873DRAFT_862068 [Choiromyces venosus 120613-1]|uniref:Uncharacterized protein n=1 Tax=Choiromyces venosus 120613-1 TaxID=1336337 RepID=A0A3N4JNN0_9PEZI|nr:hypothetical protein L873DRAFT_862068 [Choiromyces venosus 120613-1]